MTNPAQQTQKAILVRFSGHLRSLRRSRDWSQGALAREVGLSLSYVSMLERGERSPPLDTLEALATALGVTASSLIA